MFARTQFQHGLHDMAGVFTGFYDVKCDPGFRCVSRVGIFGLGHDGTYQKQPAPGGLSDRFNNSFEWGCPARGELTSTGNCKDTGKGPTSMCYSTTRYEFGADTPCGDGDNCRCVRPTLSATESTEGVIKGEKHDRRVRVTSIDGVEIDSGSYQVLSPATCEECAQHDCDFSTCKKCANCEFYDVMNPKILAGRKTPGCFDMDGGKARKERQDSRDGRAFLPYSKSSRQELVVVPHYQLWNPSEHDVAETTSDGDQLAAADIPLPNQVRKEPLSRDAWREGYKKAAPKIQRLFDTLAKTVKEDWGKLSDLIEAPSSSHLDCFDPAEGGGDNVAGKLLTVEAVQRGCQQMQETARSIAHGSTFAPTDNDVPVQCVKNDIGGGDCAELNCYTEDVNLSHALRAMRARNNQCRLVHAYLDQEEQRNGIPPPPGMERTTAGRVDLGVDIKPELLLQIKRSSLDIVTMPLIMHHMCTSISEVQIARRRLHSIEFLCLK